MAHSIGGTDGGYGAYLYHNPALSSNCFEISHFTAYKTRGSCVTTFVNTADHRAHDITCIDAELGMALNTAAAERDDVEITLWDSHFYGSSRSMDCPPGGDCHCVKKTGFINF